ncbi:PilN domain-containing protein [Thalassotalea sp. LPB0316]|uniref:PilN domain-containing protein n=1 Tax=Thalassotalea sp. LPB0316 TaxID=2769490 RepID=UPI0018678542|nr:PilN domain-containing protein [Thalassotalea sp. LPB0316]QOL26557.1 PilN domain-containing protein [Thalassotalea sp. LPB0316]
MAYINLLPWREEAQKAKQREYFTVLAAVVFGALIIVWLIGEFYQLRIDGQAKRNQYLQAEIQKLDARIGQIQTLKEKKSELEKRIAVIEQLQLSRNVGTQVLDELAKIVPNGIYLTSLEKKANMLEVIGKSESNNHLANMMRAIERSDLLTDANLESIVNDDKKSKLLSNFKMKIRIKGITENQPQPQGDKV